MLFHFVRSFSDISFGVLYFHSVNLRPAIVHRLPFSMWAAPVAHRLVASQSGLLSVRFFYLRAETIVYLDGPNPVRSLLPFPGSHMYDRVFLKKNLICNGRIICMSQKMFMKAKGMGQGSKEESKGRGGRLEMPWDSSQPQPQPTEPCPPDFCSSNLRFSTGDQTMFVETEGCLPDLLGHTWAIVVGRMKGDGSGFMTCGSLSGKHTLERHRDGSFTRLGAFVRTCSRQEVPTSLPPHQLSAARQGSGASISGGGPASVR